MVVAIGNFDGLHCGHREIFRVARSRGAVVAYTFRPHPRDILSNAHVIPLMSFEERAYALQAWSDKVIEQPFTLDFAATRPEDFIEKYLIAQCNAKIIVVGADFAFGHKRQGGLDFLASCAAQYDCRLIVVPSVMMGGAVVSSTRIRALFAQGLIEEGNALLGEPLTKWGVVMRGDRRGGQLSFPTLNMHEPMPFCGGVYVTVTEMGGVKYASMTNIGHRPTFHAAGLVTETHLFAYYPELRPCGYQGEHYGEPIKVTFLKRLRAEERFDSPALLVQQIGKDKQAAFAYLADSAVCE